MTGWTTALADLRLGARIADVQQLVRRVDASAARRIVTAHAIAAAVRQRDPQTAREAQDFAAALASLYPRLGLDETATRDLATAVAAAAGSLDRLRGTALADVRRRVWSACFGTSLYEAAWHWRDLRDQSVMVLGETGTGKELVAQTLGLANVWFRQTLTSTPHRKGQPERAPLIAFNVAALSTSNAEGELFGWERGAFTGAERARVGLVEAGHAGTIFMDEVGDMSRDLVAKLLRTIEEHEVIPFGGDAATPRLVCARWITATSKNVDRLVADGRLTEDLRRRLSGLEIHIPPLRTWELDDVRELARHHLAAPPAEPAPWSASTKPASTEPDQIVTASTGLSSQSYLARIVARFDAQLGSWLVEKRRAWPGNVRQLFQLVNTWKLQGEAQARADLDRIPDHQPKVASTQDPDDRALAQLRERVIAGSATLAEVKAWYVAHSRRPEETLRAHASRLEIDPKTASGLRAEYDALAEKLR